MQTRVKRDIGMQGTASYVHQSSLLLANMEARPGKLHQPLQIAANATALCEKAHRREVVLAMRLWGLASAAGQPTIPSEVGSQEPHIVPLG